MSSLKSLKNIKYKLNIIINKMPKDVFIGVISVVLIYVGISGIVSFATPWWLGVGDSPRHIDYAYAVWHGDIPRFEENLRIPAFNKLRGTQYQNQPASNNPPLFYIIHAPIVGPLIDSGNWKMAIAAGRAFNLLIGIITIITVSVLGWMLGNKNKSNYAVLGALFTAMSYHLVAMNLNYAVDILLILKTGIT